MTDDLPRRTTFYDSKLIHSDRWDGLRHRPDDIFICTPPKSGTTWMQAICAFLIFGRPDLPDNPGNLSPWLDAGFEPVEQMYARIEAQRHRRFLKTHSPLDAIPFFPECIYLAVYRDPRDVYISMRNHAANLKFEVFAGAFAGTVGDDFRRWAEAEHKPDDGDSFSLSGVVHHFRMTWRFRHLANLHLFHYADMLADRAAVMRRVADILDIDIDEAAMPSLVQAAGFENMRDNAARFTPNAGTGRWKDEQRFFNQGTSGQWRALMNEGDLAVYEARIAELLAPEEVVWLHRGGAIPD